MPNTPDIATPIKRRSLRDIRMEQLNRRRPLVSIYIKLPGDTQQRGKQAQARKKRACKPVGKCFSPIVRQWF
jgi:hypothetical protein